jgi:hypothetical protein
VYGNVLEEAGPKKYRVQFDDGVQRDVSSKLLRIERAIAFLPAGETRARRASTATATASTSTSTAAGTSDPASSFPLQEEDRVEDLDDEASSMWWIVGKCRHIMDFSRAIKVTNIQWVKTRYR